VNLLLLVPMVFGEIARPITSVYPIDANNSSLGSTKPLRSN
jgi:hypothetical protein